MSSISDSSSRISQITRNTRETQIQLTLNLDATFVSAGEPAEINTPLPFLNHMLNTLATHGRFGLKVQATGDIEVDPHHLVEDMGITLGLALREALMQDGKPYAGIERAGCFSFAMDATQAQVALDLCGRPNLLWQVPLIGQPLGTLDPRLFREFYKGFADAAQITLHVVVPYADNDHHVIEAGFKAFARALRQATRVLDAGGVMSTKGCL
ncbi:MAG: imidazoleglycerol-phosphate dehydratase [Vampirovibrionales bacterium]|nr:imidazoleglycerol-phosphate dehydratase [Vampirovibrionales bacterium]